MKITKKAKRIKVNWIEKKYISIMSEYQCPSCKTYFQNTLDKSIIKFRCKCGQELIIS